MTGADDVNPVENPQSFECELVIGLVGAIGTDLDRVSSVLKAQLHRTGYQIREIKISRDVIARLSEFPLAQNISEYERISRFMDAGNKIRKSANNKGILALGASAEIAANRDFVNDKTTPIPRNATIINSLKLPEEVTELRNIYSNGFVLIGVSAEEGRRRKNLERKGICECDADNLIKRDHNEEREPFGQRVQETFHLSDFFVRENGNDDQLQGELTRIVELMFGHPFHTPSFDEYAMFFAFAAALRSADLSRQVGAVITKEDQIIATGANDCPKAGGGLYWPERDKEGCLVDADFGRDYKRGVDSNRKEQDEIIEKLVELGEDLELPPEAVRELLSSKKSPIRDITEYGRVVHAEMDALTSCARSQLSTKGATLYCTTFPCHNCAKHIIAAGIEKVIYVEPYEKSKARQFHEDAVIFDSENPVQGKVQFLPFVGIGPRKYFDLFSVNLSSGYSVSRKDRDGNKAMWTLEKARLRLQAFPSSYLDMETQAAQWFNATIRGEEDKT